MHLLALFVFLLDVVLRPLTENCSTAYRNLNRWLHFNKFVITCLGNYISFLSYGLEKPKVRIAKQETKQWSNCKGH